MSIASYRVSIELSLLTSMFTLGTFDEIKPAVVHVTGLSSEVIKHFIEALMHEQTSTSDSHVIEGALVNLSVPMRI